MATHGNRFGAHGKWGSIAAQFSDATDQDQALCEQMTSPIIQRYDGDRLTVLFDEHGYRDLLLPLVLQRQLLRTS